MSRSGQIHPVGAGAGAGAGAEGGSGGAVSGAGGSEAAAVGAITRINESIGKAEEKGRLV